VQNIDALILGCTHYPILHKEIDDFLKHEVHVVDSPQIVAETVSQILSANNLLSAKRRSTKTFYLSDYTDTFARIAREFFGDDLTLEERVL
jgi:glutamate racemase